MVQGQEPTIPSNSFDVQYTINEYTMIHKNEFLKEYEGCMLVFLTEGGDYKQLWNMLGIIIDPHSKDNSSQMPIASHIKAASALILCP